MVYEVEATDAIGDEKLLTVKAASQEAAAKALSQNGFCVESIRDVSPKYSRQRLFTTAVVAVVIGWIVGYASCTFVESMYRYERNKAMFR